MELNDLFCHVNTHTWEKKKSDVILTQWLLTKGEFDFLLSPKTFAYLIYVLEELPSGRGI